MISISQLKMVFKKKVVLDNFDLKVGKGEIFGITGLNGSGKTVLLKVLATLLRPSGGKVKIAGYDVVKDQNRVRSLIGYMPDFTELDNRLTVREYLHFFLSMYRKESKGSDISSDELLNAAGLNQMNDALLSDLSRGIKQRISLARAIIHNPSILLLDDPESGMDWNSVDKMYSLLKYLCGKDKTIIISSHSISMLNSISNRIGVIHNGRLKWIFPAGVESLESIRTRFQEV